MGSQAFYSIGYICTQSYIPDSRLGELRWEGEVEDARSGHRHLHVLHAVIEVDYVGRQVDHQTELAGLLPPGGHSQADCFIRPPDVKVGVVQWPVGSVEGEMG